MMILHVNELAERLLMREPSVCLMSWQSSAVLRKIIRELRPALKERDSAIQLPEVDGTHLDSSEFANRVLRLLSNSRAPRYCVVIYGVEPLLSRAAEFLNGIREQLRHFRCMLFCIRRDREGDFIRAAPDLNSWVGLFRVKAEELNPLTLHDVRAELRRLESKYRMSTAEFLTDRSQVDSRDDSWLWAEWSAIRDSISEER